jgi:hypothetical protein
MYLKYDQSPREKSFAETADESERQTRYGRTAYNALDNVRAILAQPDGLDNSHTRIHLAALRDALEGVDLDYRTARLQ